MDCLVRVLFAHTRRNHPSCLVSLSAVGTYRSSEQLAGRMLGPVQHSAFIHTSPISLVPKGHRGDAWRMIIDLSYPSGRSVDYFIPSDLCSLCSPSVDEAVDFILELGRCTQLMRVDLKNVYCILPVHWEDRHLLGMRWQFVLTFLCLLACAWPLNFSPLLPIRWHGFCITMGSGT